MRSNDELFTGWIERIRDYDLDVALEWLWDEFDVPVDEAECIEVDFFLWHAGIHREKIWRWFDDTHSLGVAFLMGVNEYDACCPECGGQNAGYQRGVFNTWERPFRFIVCNDCEAGILDPDFPHNAFHPDVLAEKGAAHDE